MAALVIVVALLVGFSSATAFDSDADQSCNCTATVGNDRVIESFKKNQITDETGSHCTCSYVIVHKKEKLSDTK